MAEQKTITSPPRNPSLGYQAIRARVADAWRRIALPPEPVSCQRQGVTEAAAQQLIAVHQNYILPHIVPDDPTVMARIENIRFLALAMAGESGEAANIVKKAWRGDGFLDREALADEVADTISYGIALAAALEIDLSDLIEDRLIDFVDRQTMLRGLGPLREGEP